MRSASQQYTQPCAPEIQKHMALTHFVPCPYSSVEVRTSPYYTAHSMCIALCALRPASLRYAAASYVPYISRTLRSTRSISTRAAMASTTGTIRGQMQGS